MGRLFLSAYFFCVFQDYENPLQTLRSPSGVFEYTATQPERMGRVSLAGIFGVSPSSPSPCLPGKIIRLSSRELFVSPCRCRLGLRSQSSNTRPPQFMKGSSSSPADSSPPTPRGSMCYPTRTIKPAALNPQSPKQQTPKALGSNIRSSRIPPPPSPRSTGPANLQGAPVDVVASPPSPQLQASKVGGLILLGSPNQGS